jgi:hypothetical protein
MKCLIILSLIFIYCGSELPTEPEPINIEFKI